MSKPIYNQIGKSYNQTRAADSRIVSKIVSLLNLPILSKGSKILDVGAGTGSYSQALSDLGYQMTALEPSEVMQQQSDDEHDITWETGVAEQLPFDDAEFDAAIFILCIHHFTDLGRAFQEAERVTKDGKILIFTYDPSAIDAPWLFHYFPVFRDQIKTIFPTIAKLKQLLPKSSNTVEAPFPLPHDLQDGFAGAAWRTPERYLDSAYRAGTSAFQMLSDEDLAPGLTRLKTDLDSGTWDEKYGVIRNFTEYDHGYTFLLNQPHF